MKLFGIAMVRNEADVIRLSILHHLALGLDRILIVDNGSSDGTTEILERLRRDDPRIEWRTESGPYQQSLVLTELAREALRQGADWVVPFDADEFWWVRSGDLRSKLANSTVGAISGEVINFVQRRDQLTATEEGLLTMSYRPPRSINASPAMIEAGRIAFVEIWYRPKWVFRPTPEVIVGRGNHDVAAAEAGKMKGIGLQVLHAPLRSRDGLERKAEHGLRVFQTQTLPVESWHLKHWARLRANGSLDQEWAANSYEGEALDVYGKSRPLEPDMRLHDTVRPFLNSRQESGEVDLEEQRAGRVSRRHARYRGRRADPSASRSGPTTDERPTAAGAAEAPQQGIPDDEDSSGRVVETDRWRPSHLAVSSANATTVEFLRTTPSRFIAEVGIYEGHTSREIAKFLNGEGELHLFDFTDRVDAVVAELNQAGYHNVVGYGNSRKLLDSYNWSLMRILQQHSSPIYDYVFLDGGHVWALDALAFLLLDRLLKPGGYIDFDDYGWSLAISPHLNPAAFPMTAELYTEEQIREPQITLVVDLLVKRDPRYVEVIPNKIYQKVAPAAALSAPGRFAR